MVWPVTVSVMSVGSWNHCGMACHSVVASVGSWNHCGMACYSVSYVSS